MNDRTLGEAANRAVDEMAKLVARIEELAPGVWQSLVDHKHAGSLIGLVLGVFACVFAIFCWRGVRKSYARDDELAFVGWLTAGLSAAIVGAILVYCKTPDALYPEAAVMRELANKVTRH